MKENSDLLELTALKIVREGVGWKTYIKLKQSIGLKNLFSLPPKEFSQTLNLERITPPDEALEKAKLLLSKAEKEEVSAITIEDPEYPEFLKDIPSPPLILFCRGDTKLLRKPAIAIVGTRIPDSRGTEFAETTAEVVAEEGFTVVSGMAVGIDSSAHEGALKVNGKTIAVLGSGVDVVYPAENRHLYDEISRKGLVVSEYLPGSSPARWKFPARNRIISGLSRAVLVVQAPADSGAIITANHAFRQGKIVGAVPGSPKDPLYEGCNELIKRGAHLITSPIEIVDLALGIKHRRARELFTLKNPNETPIELSEKEKTVYDIIGYDGITPDEISETSGLPPAEVSAVITMLTIKGLVETLPGGRIARI